MPDEQQIAAAANVVAFGVGPSWDSWLALVATVMMLLGIVVGVVAIGFSPGVLVPGTALLVAADPQEALTWCAAGVGGTHEAVAYTPPI